MTVQELYDILSKLGHDIPGFVNAPVVLDAGPFNGEDWYGTRNAVVGDDGEGNDVLILMSSGNVTVGTVTDVEAAKFEKTTCELCPEYKKPATPGQVMAKMDAVIEHMEFYLKLKHSKDAYEAAQVLGELLERRMRMNKVSLDAMRMG